MLDALREARTRQGKTYQQLSDETGIPPATISRFFSGVVDNPGIFTVAILCAALGVPLMPEDGIYPPESESEIDRLQMQLGHKNELLAERERSMECLMNQSRLMESGIATRDEQLHRKDDVIKAAQDGNRPLIFGLMSLCIMLAAVLIVYISLDALAPDIGLIRTDGVSPVIVLGALSITACCMYIGHWVAKRKVRKKEDENRTS